MSNGMLRLQGFNRLPDANKLTFMGAEPVDLRQLLPNLPDYEQPDSHFALDLVKRLLVYPPEQRLKARNALEHGWLRSGALLLPPGYSEHSETVWRDQTLGEILQKYLGAGRDGGE